MKSKIAWAAALGLALLATAWWTTQSGEPARSVPAGSRSPLSEPDPSTGPVAPVAASAFVGPTARSKEPAIPSAPEERWARAAEDLKPKGFVANLPLDGRARIDGTWTDSSGLPRSRRLVRAVEGDQDSGVRPQTMTSSAMDGTFTLHLDPGTYEVLLGDTSYEVRLGRGEVRRLDHREHDGCELAVRVVGPRLRSENASVTLRSGSLGAGSQELEALTDGSGVARLSGVRPGPAVVTASAYPLDGGHAVSTEMEVNVPAAPRAEIRVNMPDLMLAVLVVAADGSTPVGAATITLKGGRDARGIRRTRCDAGGRARLDHLSPGPVRFKVEHAAHAPRLFRIDITPETREVQLRLGAAYDLPVEVRDDRGEPLVVVLRAVWNDCDDAAATWEARADDAGRAVFNRLPKEGADVTLLVDGHAPITLRLPARGETDLLKLEFRRLAPR